MSEADGTTGVEDPVTHYERYVDAWNDHDTGAVMSMFAPDVTYDDPATDGTLDRHELEPFVEEVFAGFPDVRFEVRRITRAAEGGVLTVEWTFHGTHEGTYEGLPPTGERVELDGMERVEITDEGITAVRGYFDMEAFTAELGLDFPAVVGKLPKLTAGAVRNAL